MIRRPPRSTLDRSSAALDVYKRQTQRDVPEHPAKAALRSGEFAQRVDIETGTAPFDRCLLYTSPSPRDRTSPRMPSSA